MTQKIPLFGLVLAGGRSKRLGQDKTIIPWHGTAQSAFLYQLLQKWCDDVYLSRRREQQAYDSSEKIIFDSSASPGPYGAILSAFEHRPDVAWLVIASDLPLLNAATLEFRVDHRDRERIATTFRGPHDGLPEPLVTIWEPRSYEILLAHAKLGFTCPRKVLIKTADACVLEPPDPDALANVNTPDDLKEVKTIMSRRENFWNG
jgi:molybdenum cofactor guanylyltransferase